VANREGFTHGAEIMASFFCTASASTLGLIRLCALILGFDEKFVLKLKNVREIYLKYAIIV